MRLGPPSSLPLPYVLSGDASLVASMPCFSPVTELICGRELTLFKLTTPSVTSTGYTALPPPSLATSQFSALHSSHALTATWISCLCPYSPFSLPPQGPSHMDMLLLGHQLLSLGDTAEQTEAVLLSS